MNRFNQTQALFAEAVQLFQRGDLNGAEARCRQVIAADRRFPPAHDVLGNIHLRRGAFAEAEKEFRVALTINAAMPEIRINLAAAQLRLRRLDEAVANARQALALAPNHPRALAVLGPALRMLSRFEEAAEFGRKAVAANPQFPPAHADLGAALDGLERFEEALECYERALRLAPDFAEAWCAKGKTQLRLDRPVDAEATLRQALRLRSDFALAHSGLGEALAAQDRHDEALLAFLRSLELAPGDPDIHFSFGLWNQMRGRWEDAALGFARALDIRPGFAEAAARLGEVFHSMRRLKDAAEAYKRALEADPNLMIGLAGQGALYLELGRDAEAVDVLTRAYATDPSWPNALDMLVLARMQLCAWSGLEEGRNALFKRIQEGNQAANPFVAILAGANSRQQQSAARNWTRSITPSDAPLFRHQSPSGGGEGRLRIGYLSSDLQEHPIGYLAAGIFEAHDRSRFELHAYCLGVKDDSPMRRRIEAAFEHFHEIADMGAAEAAKRIHADGIDILVDLNGYTSGGNPAILAYRPAPIQVNYLGYPGTMGAEFMDYVLADPVSVPFAEQPWFDERIVHLPHCYQPNDGRRQIAPRVPSRVECGLPESGFVFCCFNNPNKLTQDVFRLWLRLLWAVPDAVLWLLDPKSSVKDNLRAELAAAGLDDRRLVFAARVPLAEHLARHQAADLFLDTLPYNAHTTASDALWAGLPLLTRRGDTFAGRVASSLLVTMGLDGLITNSTEEYEALAIRLATEPDLLAQWRTRLAEARQTSPLFDTQLYTRHLEAAYQRMWEIRQAGRPPESFAVAP